MAKCLQHANLGERAYGKQNAEEEEYRAYVYAREAFRYALPVFGGNILAGAVEDTYRCPQQAEYEQYPHKRRQVGKSAEYGHENQSAHADKEHCLALRRSERRHTAVIAAALRLFAQFAVQRELEYEHRYYERNNGRYGHLAQDSYRGYVARYPKHYGCYVANGRGRAAGIGGYYYHGGVEHTLLLVAHEFTQNHHHHYARGHVVENGREDERHYGYLPQQHALGARSEVLAHEVEASVAVYYLHYCHGAHEEEKYLARFAYLCQQAAVHVGRGRGCPVGNFEISRIGANGVEHPAGNEHQQRNGGFVDLCERLEGNEQVTYDEHGYD